MPELGSLVPSKILRRFWTMLAHWHGQVWNGAEFGRAFGVSHTTVRRYLDLLSSVFVVSQLQPWHENIGKRQVIDILGASAEQCFHWSTHSGAELDLLVLSGSKRYGFEVKPTEAPRLTASMRSAFETLRLDRLEVVHAGQQSFALAKNIRALPAQQLAATLRPLRR